MSIRLMKFVSSFDIGGTERQVVNLTKGLASGGVNVRLACFDRTGDLLAECEQRSWPIEEYRIQSLYGYRTFKQQMAFGKNLRRHKVQVLHTYSFYPNVFAIPAARLAGVPVIVGSVRDTHRKWTHWQHEVQKVCLRMADHVVVNAEAIKRHLLERGYDIERMTVIPNGIDCQWFLAPCIGKMTVREELNIPRDAPVVGFLSRLETCKGHDCFLRAAALVVARIPSVRFLIVGDTKYEPEVREKLKILVMQLGIEDRVIFTGFRIDIPEVLAALSVSVQPSLDGEGLSNALLESMAAGVPVVTTQIGGALEIIENGTNGLLVPPADVEALARAICRLLRDRTLARKIGKTSKEHVHARYSLALAVERTEKLYSELLRRAERRYWSWRTPKTKAFQEV